MGQETLLPRSRKIIRGFESNTAVQCSVHNSSATFRAAAVPLVGMGCVSKVLGMGMLPLAPFSRRNTVISR